MTQTVLVTGAGIGIGRATAKAFGKAGYHVIATDILEKEGQSVVAEIGKTRRVPSSSMCARRKMPTPLLQQVEKKHGALDCIVANAGIAHQACRSSQTDGRKMGLHL